VLTSGQLRAARSFLDLSAEELAEKCGVSRRTIGALEKGHGVPVTGTQTLQKVQNALEAAGIEFIGSPHDGPGIRLRSGACARPASDGN
jgi:transcriptional regulator with XRE-family HTH domain